MDMAELLDKDAGVIHLLGGLLRLAILRGFGLQGQGGPWPGAKRSIFTAVLPFHLVAFCGWRP